MTLALELLVVLGAIALGARAGGVAMGLWGGVGLAVLVFGFGEKPGSIPGDVLLIILTVIMAASAMEAAGGIDFLVRIAARIIRKSPRHVTIIAPVVSYVFTFLAGTGHVFYPLLPVIYEVSMKGGVRPERPISVATIASQMAITASPVSAATAALIAILGPRGIGLPEILMICVPATLLGVVVAALIQTRIGVELDQDQEYKRRLATGEVEAGGGTTEESAPAPLPRGAPLSAYLFLGGVAAIVCCGLFPDLRQLGPPSEPGPVPRHREQAATVAAVVANPDQPFANLAAVIIRRELNQGEAAAAHHQRIRDVPRESVSMPMTIAIIMFTVAAAILLLTTATADQIVKTKTCNAGLTAVIGILGLAWLGDTFMDANQTVIVGGLSRMAQAYPALFSLGLFVTSMLLYSQAATTQTLMPLGLTLGIPAASLAGMFPAVNGYFFIPTYGTVIAAVNFDRSGTTRIGKYVLNHSFMLPGLIASVVSVGTGLVIAKVFF